MDDAHVLPLQQAHRHVPASLIDQKDGVRTRRNILGDLRKVQVHRFGVAGWQDQGRALALPWADRSEDVA